MGDHNGTDGEVISQSYYVAKYHEYAKAADKNSLTNLLRKGVKCDRCAAVVKGTAAAFLRCPRCGASWE